MIKAVILAAGIGSRLEEITARQPKCLTKVGNSGKSILEHQIEGYIRAGIDEKDINVVVGYKSEQIIDFLSEKYPNVQIFENERYRETNNMFSLYIFLNKQTSLTNLFISNGDCIYSQDIVKEFYNISLTQNKCFIACDNTFYDAESMKIQTKNRRIVKISKDISQKDFLALSIDLYHLTSQAVSIFFSQIKQYVAKNMLNLWTEVALQDIFSNTDFFPYFIPQDSRWIEIDTKEDLLKGHRLFSNFDLRKKKVCICDLDGTVYIGNEPIDGAIEFINENKKDIIFYFLTNNTSKTPHHYQNKLRKLGIEIQLWQILTPLEPLIAFLNSSSYKNVVLIANHEVENYIKQHVTKDINNSNIPYDGVVLTYDNELTYSKIQLASIILNQTRLLISTHQDKMCPTEFGPIPDIGSFIAMLTATLGDFETISFGKPSIDILQKILTQHSIDECFIVGDRLYTDYTLAKDANIDFLCVLSGETKIADIQKLEQIANMTIIPHLSSKYIK